MNGVLIMNGVYFKCGDGLTQLKETNLFVKKTFFPPFSININHEWCSMLGCCL